LANLYLLCCLYDYGLYLLRERSQILGKNYNIYRIFTHYNAFNTDIERVVFTRKFFRIGLPIKSRFQQNNEFSNLERSYLVMPISIFDR